MRFFTIYILVFVSNLVWAGPIASLNEIEVKSIETEKSILRRKSRETEIASISQSRSSSEAYFEQEFDSTRELRTKRRVGLGLQAMGATGLFGAMIELNFQPQNSVVTAFGGGPGYNAVNFQWRHLFLGQSLSPYTGLGYARWYNAAGSGPLGETTPSLLGTKLLTDEEKASGKFGMDLFNPSFGLQYNVLTGPQAAAAYFLEINFLMRISRLSPITTASLGAIYYF